MIKKQILGLIKPIDFLDFSYRFNVICRKCGNKIGEKIIYKDKVLYLDLMGSLIYKKPRCNQCLKKRGKHKD